jgi:hypothetical protein
VINRSESQLIAKDQHNQIRKSSSKPQSRPGTPARGNAPQRKKAS